MQYIASDKRLQYMLIAQGSQLSHRFWLWHVGLKPSSAIRHQTHTTTLLWQLTIQLTIYILKDSNIATSRSTCLMIVVDNILYQLSMLWENCYETLLVESNLGPLILAWWLVWVRSLSDRISPSTEGSTTEKVSLVPGTDASVCSCLSFTAPECVRFRVHDLDKYLQLFGSLNFKSPMTISTMHAIMPATKNTSNAIIPTFRGFLSARTVSGVYDWRLLPGPETVHVHE